MTHKNLMHWLLKALLFAIVIDILVLACCRADSPTDEPMIYIPQTAPEVYWPTLLDGEITFQSDQEIAAWIEATIEEGWRIEATHKSEDYSADLQITVQEDIIYNGNHACGLAGSGRTSGICYVTLSLWCFEQEPNFIYDDVPEKVLLHEVGHCMGLDHRDWGVMVTPAQYGTTERDIEEIHTMYGLHTGE